jgi:hypothetical protein
LKGKVVMKKTVLLPSMALLVLLGISAPVVAEESVEEMEKRCQSYAVEDSIPADEVDNYIKECIADIQRESAEANSESASESDSETEESKE